MTTEAVARGSVISRGLAITHALLECEVARMRAAGIPVGEDDYRGLYISDNEADRLLGTDAEDEGAGSQAFVEAREALLRLAAEPEGPLGKLVQLAGLTAFDVGVVLLCLASESDLGTERLISYVQDDVTKKRPRVDLAVRLLGGEPGAARDAFGAGAPLRRLRYVTLHHEPGQPHTPLLARYIALDPRVAGYLLGQSGMDEDLHAFTRQFPGATPGAVPAEPALSQVRALAGLPATSLVPPVVALSAADPAERLAAAALLAEAAGLGVLQVDLPGVATEIGFETAVAVAAREAAFQDSVLVLDRVDELNEQDAGSLRERLMDWPVAPLTVLASEAPIRWPGVSIECSEQGFDAHRGRWEAGLEATDNVSQDELDALAGKFRLNADRIADAVRGARGRALTRNPRQPRLEVEDLYVAARTQSTPILSDLARKISPHYSWDELILPADAREQLREMCAFVEHRHLVYETWGLGRKLAMGKGLIALFAGHSGTGKTMAADVIAGTLGLDLYKIDLSGVVSKYIGETEKNLGRIFEEARTSNAILFFDEADALFGKRSEVKDSHDRYANIETAYLLQKMEEYSGVVILATNLKMNLDEAFLRRLHFVLDFPLPEEEDRRRIWETTMPAELPLSGDIDLAFLARQFRIAGGNIRNIVLAAAFLAASDGREVSMAHLIRATRREYQKLGRMVTDAEFGPYVELLR